MRASWYGVEHWLQDGVYAGRLVCSCALVHGRIQIMVCEACELPSLECRVRRFFSVSYTLPPGNVCLFLNFWVPPSDGTLPLPLSPPGGVGVGRWWIEWVGGFEGKGYIPGAKGAEKIFFYIFPCVGQSVSGWVPLGFQPPRRVKCCGYPPKVDASLQNLYRVTLWANNQLFFEAFHFETLNMVFGPPKFLSS